MTTNSIITIRYQDNIDKRLEKKFKFLEKKWLKELLESAEVQIRLEKERESCLTEIKRRNAEKTVVANAITEQPKVMQKYA